MVEKIVKVEWEDACFDSGWYDKNAIKRYEQLITESIGFIIKETEECIIMGTDRWENEYSEAQYRHISTIPREMIREITELKGE